jgi:hypothetical protein
MEMRALLAILFRLSSTFELIASTQRELRRAIHRERRAAELDTSAPGSWRDPAGESPAQVRCSARLVVSVALWKATTTAKRTQQSSGVGY